MITKEKWFPILYMFVATSFFSTIVIGFTKFTSEQVEVNEQLASEKAFLIVIPGLYDDSLSRLELHRRFTEQMTEPDESSGGAYTFKENGRIVTYALPLSGQGFWAPIEGVIGIRADRKTITGIYFYEQNETPGLGAEITNVSFRKQFEGKEISSVGKPMNFRRSSEVLARSEVHAVTGATQTSTRLEKIINDAIEDWRRQLDEQVD